MSSLNTPIRTISVEAHVYRESGGTASRLMSFTHEDRIKSIEVQRIGEENKFFGFGICQRLNIHLIDVDKELEFTTENYFKIKIGDTWFPKFYITEVNRDENTNELSITAYDKIYFLNNYTVADLRTVNVGLTNVIDNTAQLMGVTDYQNIHSDFKNIDLDGNFEGTEGLRDVLNSAAEATGAIYYLWPDTSTGANPSTTDKLFFRGMYYLTDERYNLIPTITPEDYFTLKTGTNRRLSGICSTTELGDNVEAKADFTGTIQYFRNNPFLEMYEQISGYIGNLFNKVNGMTIAQFEITWRGLMNIDFEPGSFFKIQTKEGDLIETYLFNDTVKYDGTLSQKSEWQFNPTNDGETAGNPASLGEALKYTYARVDKVNREIELVASENTQFGEKIAQIQITTDSINQSVQRIEQSTKESLDGLQEEIQTITSKVETQITPEDVTIQIKKELESQDGVTSITTTTGFRFDEDGLTVSKTGTEMSTIITEDGMVVYKDDTAMLVANNQGVVAHNLSADTYLIIGKHSRFEDFVKDYEDRTGCFWIGGSN